MKADIQDGYCWSCGAECGRVHVCPDPEVLQPQPPSKPFVKRWDPIAGLWVHCMVENGTAWEPKSGTYTEVQPGEQLTAVRTDPTPPFSALREAVGKP